MALREGCEPARVDPVDRRVEGAAAQRDERRQGSVGPRSGDELEEAEVLAHGRAGTLGRHGRRVVLGGRPQSGRRRAKLKRAPQEQTHPDHSQEGRIDASAESDQPRPPGVEAPRRFPLKLDCARGPGRRSTGRRDIDRGRSLHGRPRARPDEKLHQARPQELHRSDREHLRHLRRFLRLDLVCRITVLLVK